MTKQLEEIKRLAEEVSDSGIAGLSENISQLAKHCLRLVAALEKCQEQRDGITLSSDYDWDLKEYDAELSNILSGEVK